MIFTFTFGENFTKFSPAIVQVFSVTVAVILSLKLELWACKEKDFANTAFSDTKWERTSGSSVYTPIDPIKGQMTLSGVTFSRQISVEKMENK